MQDALGARLDVAVKQRGVGRNPEPMRDLVDLEPALGADLLMEDLAPHALAEHLGTTARQRVEPRLAQTLEHPLGGLAREAAEEVDLDRRVGLDAERGLLL